MHVDAPLRKLRCWIVARRRCLPHLGRGHYLDMPRRLRYSAKEHRQVEHIKESEEARGLPEREAEAIAYATVNKQNPAKHRYSAKEKRQAEHIAESEVARGKSKLEARQIGYATVNKRSRG